MTEQFGATSLQKLNRKAGKNKNWDGKHNVFGIGQPFSETPIEISKEQGVTWQGIKYKEDMLYCAAFGCEKVPSSCEECILYVRNLY